MRKAFTLIELLVVITIIVILLALLMPALDKAIYQAELASCGARLKGIGTSVVTYAVGSNRHYPYRQGVYTQSWRPNLIINPRVDDTAALRDYLSINGHFQCPLVTAVKLENSYNNAGGQSAVFASYYLWYGWQYRGHQGMRRLGDAFAWDGARFTLLAGDYDFIARNRGFSLGSHPDKDGRMTEQIFQDSDLGAQLLGVGLGNLAGTATYSRWAAVPSARGLIDMNFAYDDGSVRRFVEVTHETRNEVLGDERLTFVPEYTDDSNVEWQNQIPEAGAPAQR